AGFLENETSRMLLAASPPSRRPGLSPLRGSLLLGYVCAARSDGRTRDATNANALRARCIERLRLAAGWGLLLGQLWQQLAHGADLGGLHRHHVIREDVDVDVLTSARRGKEILDHLQRALVVLDHEREERVVERDATGGIERLELLLAQHARHLHRAPR